MITENFSNKIKNIFSKINVIPTGIWALSIANLLISISTTMTFSISPFFITEVLGLNTFTMGVMDGVSEGLSQIIKFCSGIMTDTFKRKKPLITAGLFLAAISKPIFILANGPVLIMVSKIIERISNGLIATPRDAYVATEAPNRKKGLCLGILVSFKAAGCTVGSWLIALLLLFYKDYRFLLWIGFFPALLSVLISLIYISEKPPQTTSKGTGAPRWRLNYIRDFPTEYWLFLTIAFLFMAARFSETFLVLHFKELGASMAMAASVMGIFNIVSSLSAIPIGNFLDKHKEIPVLYVTFILLITAHGLLALANGIWLGLLGILFWGVQRGVSQILFVAIITKLVPEKIIGTAIGFFYLISGLASLIAGVIGGWLSTRSLVYTFVYGSLISGISLIILIISSRKIDLINRREPGRLV